jgi:AraC family transcriptional regulator
MNRALAEAATLHGPPGLRFVQIDYTAELQMPLHAHADAASLNFCLSGATQEFRDRRTCQHGPSCLSLMPAGVPHANRFGAGASIFLVVLGAPWIHRLRQFAAVLDDPVCHHGGHPAWIAARMHREFLRGDELTPLALEGMLLELVAELARSTPPYSEEDAPTWLRPVLDFLHAHFTAKLSSDAVAAAAGVHPSHLMRAFRRRQGRTIGEYLRGLRVEYARHLLEGSDTPLGQVALDSGFCDQGHFTRAFKAHVGLSPGQFRRAHGRARRGQETQL